MCRLLYYESELIDMNKEKRRQLIAQLVTEQEVKTQEELQYLLCKNGLDVTQATISRDIRTLGLIKVQAKDGSLKYSFNIDQKPLILKKLYHILSDAMVSMEVITHFILIKTLPGNAHSIGVLLDSIELEGKAGTICGNDTCLIICRSHEEAAKIAEQLDILN